MECGARRLDRKEIQQLLGGKWVVFAGDSITRMLYAALLRAAGSKGAASAARRPAQRAAAWTWRGRSGRTVLLRCPATLQGVRPAQRAAAAWR